MEKKDAIISIKSEQASIEDGTVEVVTKGKLYKKNDLYYAIYEETEISGMKGTTTTIKIGKDKFSLLRMGDRKSTRLNSSHANISYAVFCLKKKRRLTSSAQICSPSS